MTSTTQQQTTWKCLYMLRGLHQNLYQTLHSVFNYLNLDNDVIPSNEVIIANLKSRYAVCDYVWENIDQYLTCLARECSRSYHGLSSDCMDSYYNERAKTIAVLYDSQCQLYTESLKKLGANS